DVPIDVGFLENQLRVGRPNAVDVTQRDADRLVVGNVDACDTWHNDLLKIHQTTGSALPLLVLGVGTDHPDHAIAADDLTVFTDSLDAAAYLHDAPLMTVSDS